jgi:hypothetical protein
MTSKRRNKHKPEQIVVKLRDADEMLSLAAVLQALEISEATLHRSRAGQRWSRRNEVRGGEAVEGP